MLLAASQITFYGSFGYMGLSGSSDELSRSGTLLADTELREDSPKNVLGVCLSDNLIELV